MGKKSSVSRRGIVSSLVMTIVIAMSSVVTGCGPANSSDLGSLVSFAYGRGSVSFGFRYELERVGVEGAGDGQFEVRFVVIKDGMERVVDTTVPLDVLTDLEVIIEENKIAAWDGFDGWKPGVTDGSSFALDAQFTNGTITARGIARFPAHWKRGDEALTTYLEDLARFHS